ncbi:hypothetical protein ACVWWO_003422 [Bradyrhizobium sp. F1.13.1]
MPKPSGIGQCQHAKQHTVQHMIGPVDQTYQPRPGAVAKAARVNRQEHDEIIPLLGRRRAVPRNQSVNVRRGRSSHDLGKIGRNEFEIGRNEPIELSLSIIKGLQFDLEQLARRDRIIILVRFVRAPAQNLCCLRLRCSCQDESLGGVNGAPIA